jgi:hypothetical protein
MTINALKQGITLLTHAGYRFRIVRTHDEDAGFPWENSDCHGVITAATRDNRANLPFNWYYDWERSYVKAAEVWGIPMLDAPIVVRQDYDRIKAWLDSDWHYQIVQVTLEDASGNLTALSESMCGVESDDPAEALIREMIQEILGHPAIDHKSGVLVTKLRS